MAWPPPLISSPPPLLVSSVVAPEYTSQTVKKKSNLFPTLVLLFFSNLIHLSLSRDTIIPTQPLIHPQTLVSSGDGVFELGFFAPNKGSPDHLYLGIWYKNLTPQTVVWVANRRTPVPPSAGSLNLTRDGNLAVGRVWSTNTSGLSEPVVQLLDTGNLVLTDGSDSSAVWQSFDYPSDSLLPGMKLGWNLTSNFDRQLTSWTSESEPAPGHYSSGMDLKGQLFIWNRSRPEYRARPWDGRSWSGASSLNSTYPIIPDFVSTPTENYYTYETVDPSIISFSKLNHLGAIVRFMWSTDVWKSQWSLPGDACDHYGRCGPYGVCNNGTSPIICNCLEGFEPNSKKDWGRGDGGGGCKRKAAINCSMENQFQKVSQVKLPDMSNASVIKYVSSDDCRDRCLENCSCVAYAFLNEGTGCITWAGDLVDIRLWLSGAGEDLYVRMARGGSQRRAPMIAAVSSTIGLLIIVTLFCFVWMRRRKRRGIVEVASEESPFALENVMAINLGETKSGDSEFSIFQFSSIAFATENFSNLRKLGEGGFGSVYKGRLPSGQEIAVKRLAAHSGQGLEEFKNEIVLIAKLQHRNLVKLLGCSIQGEEKLLVYEYMPNKSLDFLLFDPASGAQLDWGSRSHIVEGIAQGLLYLHKHSRLRIIHRDLKPSNILLDADMNPKISDFGMARIFASNVVQANTIRVVGTYGYMSPEYAAEGLFSIKSDVFSFGVILLEIISGKRNIGFHHEIFLNLLGYSWVLWKEGKWMELVDPKTKHEICHVGGIERCIHLALLCVQEFPVDRPTMSIVVTMLSSESVVLPDPKQPAFFNVRIRGAAEFESGNTDPCSQNEMTITVVDGR